MKANYSVMLLAAVCLIVSSASVGLSEMVVTTRDGKEYRVPVGAEEIKSITFGVLSSSGGGKDEAVVFMDGFDDGKLTNWEGTAAGRRVENGVAEFYSDNHTTFLLKRPVLVEDIVVEWRGAAYENGFHGSLGPYGFNIGGWNNSAVGCSGPGAPFQRITTGKVYEPGRFHVWKVVRLGDSLAVYVDEKKVVERTIKGRQEEGRLKFTTYRGKLQIDWIKIYRP